MTSITMKSPTPTEFSPFPGLPIELRQMVWNEAVPNPTQDFQRLKAEIASQLLNLNGRGLVLCLTPHDEFVELTRDYLRLLGACRDSRAAALAKIDSWLPIHYIARDESVRFTRVPFNSDGQLCISGLCEALDLAAKGYDARGDQVHHEIIGYRHMTIARGIQCVTLSKIKNLTIALDPPLDPWKSEEFMLGWSCAGFDTLARRMLQLKTMALVDECWLNERRDIDSASFEWVHKPTPFGRWNAIEASEIYEDGVPILVHEAWYKLYEDFESNMRAFEDYNGWI